MQNTTLRLIHIPLQHYSLFHQPVLQVLLAQGPNGARPSSNEAGEAEGLTEANEHIFLNISITPIECSIVCHQAWVTKVFEPTLRKVPKEVAKSISISKDTYLVFSVISAGLDAGSRVVDLTSPLALAGIPIFFITTYYSDFILVPSKDRQSVVQALVSRGFHFSEDQSSFVAPGPFAQHVRGDSNTSDPPSTPPPSNAKELQSRTFELLKRRNVIPYIEADLHLVQCSGRGNPSGGYSRPLLNRTNTGSDNRQSWVDSVDTKLYTCLIAAMTCPPQFLSITFTQDDQPSLLLDRTILHLFSDSVVGDRTADLVPIFLDLSQFPIEATGIVSGVAGRLVQDLSEGAELSYLSTAKSGAVILTAEQSAKAMDILKPLLAKD
jgi:hypothetical protein